MDGEKRTTEGGLAQREKSPAKGAKVSSLFGGDKKQAKKTGAGPTAGGTGAETNSSADEKFVPTCKICGKKHWPFHPLVPCLNVKKVKAKAKAENSISKKGGEG